MSSCSQTLSEASGGGGLQKNTLEIAVGEKTSSEEECGQEADAVIGSGSPEGGEHRSTGRGPYSLDLEPNSEHCEHGSIATACV